MPRFSIVVPSYNVEAYVRNCLDSLLAQTFGDFEVICVDDASTDGTNAIITSYCERDARVRLVRNAQNMHLFATRHVGTRETSGEYVLFVDGDDELVPDALERIDAQLKKNPVDILQFPMKAVPDSESDVEIKEDAWYCQPSEPKLLEGDEIIGKICYEQPDDMCAHHRVFRGDLARRVLPELGFERGIAVAEDIVELIALMLEADSYEVVDTDPLYLYYIGRGISSPTASLPGEAFLASCVKKRRCYEITMDYLERKGACSVGVCVPVEWRWRYSCAQTMYEWQDSVRPEDRLSALEGFMELWPAAWVLPSIYSFVAEGAERMLYPDRVYPDGPVDLPAVKRSFMLNLRCLGAAFLHYNANPVQVEKSNPEWEILQEGFEDAGFFSDDSTSIPDDVRPLLHCVRSLCLFQRNEAWLADDRAMVAKYEAKERAQGASGSHGFLLGRARGLASRALGSARNTLKSDESSQSAR